MPLPRNLQDAEAQMRAAAIDRLRAAGIKLDIRHRNPQGIANAIRALDPSFDEYSRPMSVIRDWLGFRPDGAVAARTFVDTGRPYVMSAQMRVQAIRAQCQPRMHMLSSRVPPGWDYERLL